MKVHVLALIMLLVVAIVGNAATDVFDERVYLAHTVPALAMQLQGVAPQLQDEFCCNPALTQKQRVEAAERLARLEYYPAIPAILERITERREDNELKRAYAGALSIYGEAALPEIVDMLEKTTARHIKDGEEEERKSALGDIIIEARLQTVVLSILRGRFAATLDRAKQRELKSIIRFVSKLKENDDGSKP